jgi:deoxycytidine triphosphate deaminase
MSIKSDKWIRRMAEEHGMIEPFEPGQVRQNAAGEKIVSYGTSSYGYDIRCAPEFKVFTNIYSTVVTLKILMKRVLSTFNRMFASFHPTVLLWHAQWNTFVFLATC